MTSPALADLSRLILDPPWGAAGVLTLAAALAAMLGVRLWRERKTVAARRQAASVLIRVGVIALLVAVALNPTWLTPKPTAGKPGLTVLVDASASMGTADVEGGTRLAAAAAALDDPGLLSRLSSRFDLRVRGFAEDVEALSPGGVGAIAAEGRSTRLAAAVTRAVSELGSAERQAGVLLVSDGRTTDAGIDEAAGFALARSTPVWSWTLGDRVVRRDLSVTTPGREVLAFAGDRVTLTATLRQEGYENRTFDVEVVERPTGAEAAAEGVADTAEPPAVVDRVIDRVRVAPGIDGRATVETTIVAPPDGERSYRFRVPVQHEEADPHNNAAEVFVRSVGDRVRVLVVEGQPHWDTKFLVQSFKRSDRVELTAVYRLSADRQFAVLSARGEQERRSGDFFPRTAADFERYDVVLMGRGCEVFFDDDTAGLLARYVADGGGSLVFSRGRAYDGRFEPLARLEPVVWGGRPAADVRLEPTPAGRSSPLLELDPGGDVETMLARLPRFDVAAGTLDVKPLGTVLATGRAATGGADPVLVAFHRFGAGRVVTVNAGGIWRWAFRETPGDGGAHAAGPSGGGGDEGVYDRFWLGLLRWLISDGEFIAGHRVSLRSDRRVYTEDQPVRLLVRTRGLDDAADAYRPRVEVKSLAATRHGHADAAAAVARVEPAPAPSLGPGSYMAEVGPLPVGSYDVTLTSNVGEPAELRSRFSVIASSVESRNLSADPGLMRRLAEATGGSAIEEFELAGLPGLVAQYEARRLGEDRRPVWDRGWVMALLLAALAAEWLVRRREGLV